MRRARKAICVGSGSVCPVVDRVLASTGITATHVAAWPAGVDDEVGLVIVDRAARQAAGEALCGSRVPVVVLGDDLDDDGLIELMLEGPVSHLLEDPDDPTLGVTTRKLATGDLFGLEQYLAAGAQVSTRTVTDDLGKRRAMDEITAWAETVGARRPVVHRIASVVDELLMNARGGREGHGSHRAELRWAADERTLALSVSDDNGTLRQRDVIDHVRRAQHERGRPEPAGPDGAGGAGLGLYLVLANVASLVINVEPGRRTEIVCLFDLSREAPRRARRRSLHVFGSAAS